MLDLGIDKLALIGAVALIVVGPERLPRVARTVGHLLGKAQRYVADVKAEVSRSIELEELQKTKRDLEDGARQFHSTVKSEFDETQRSFNEVWHVDPPAGPPAPVLPSYRHPGKRWRLKRGAVPQWYKQREGTRRHIQSAAARVARHRPAGQRAPR